MRLKDDARGHALLIGMSITIAFFALLVLAQAARSNLDGAQFARHSAAKVSDDGRLRFLECGPRVDHVRSTSYPEKRDEEPPRPHTFLAQFFTAA